MVHGTGYGTPDRDDKDQFGSGVGSRGSRSRGPTPPPRRPCSNPNPWEVQVVPGSGELPRARSVTEGPLRRRVVVTNVGLPGRRGPPVDSLPEELLCCRTPVSTLGVQRSPPPVHPKTEKKTYKRKEKKKILFPLMFERTATSVGTVTGRRDRPQVMNLGSRPRRPADPPRPTPAQGSGPSRTVTVTSQRLRPPVSSS